MRFTNHYHHKQCGTSWDDDWHCCCNDTCPRCGTKEIEPEDSTDHLPEMITAFLAATADPEKDLGVNIVDRAIDWLVEKHGWSREELGPEYQRGDIEDELQRGGLRE